MKRNQPVFFVCLVAVVYLGCSTCRKEVAPVKEPVPEPVEETETQPAPAEAVQAEPPPPPVVDPKARYRRAPVPVQPLSHWGLDTRTLTLMRVKTAALGQPGPEDGNPMDLAGFSYVALDTREPLSFELQDKMIDEIRGLLVQQKIFSTAVPLTIFPLKGKGGMSDWELGIPVAAGTEVKAPLVLKEFPGGKAFSKTLVQKDVMDTTAEKVDEGDERLPDAKVTDADPRKHLMQQAMAAGLKPVAAMVRWLDFADWLLLYPDFRIEVMVVGNQGASPVN